MRCKNIFYLDRIRDNFIVLISGNCIVSYYKKIILMLLRYLQERFTDRCDVRIKYGVRERIKDFTIESHF